MKTWHLLGTVIVIISFPLLFTLPVGMEIDPCKEINESKYSFESNDNDALLNCDHNDELWLVIYYSFLAVLIHFGWAAVQIAHLSMIPDITLLESEQMSLISFRNAATFGAFIFVYLVAWILVGNGRFNDNMISRELCYSNFKNALLF